MSANVDINAKKLSFSGGSGGGGKMMQQLELPMSDKYFDDAYKWEKISYPNIVGNLDFGDVVGDFLYVNDDTHIKKINLKTYAITSKPIGGIGASPIVTFFYNGIIYEIAFLGVNVSFYKCNESTVSRTKIFDLSQSLNGLSLNSFCWVSEDIIFYSYYQYYSGAMSYLFYGAINLKTLSFEYPTTKIELGVSASIGQMNAIQKIDTGILFAITLTTSQVIKIYKLNLSDFAVTLHGEIPNINSGRILGVQIGDEMLCISNTKIQSKDVLAIDLNNKTVNPFKFEDSEFVLAASQSIGNLYKHNDRVIQLRNNASVFLPLVEKPPQENGLVLKILKGQKYNILKGSPIHVLALNATVVIGGQTITINQEAFNIILHQQVATKNLYIYDGLYKLPSDRKILIEN